MRKWEETVEEKPFLGVDVKPMTLNNITLCYKQRMCWAALFFGSFLLALAIVVLTAGPKLLEGIIMDRMALTEGSEMLKFWLDPPIIPELTGYAFHVTNPEEVQMGEKPVLEEVGPFVYRSIIVKDSKNEETGGNNLQHNDDGETLTYRPRYKKYIRTAIVQT